LVPVVGKQVLQS